MASKINKISGVVLNRLVEPGLYGDGRGLWLQVSASTSRSWISYKTSNEPSCDVRRSDYRHTN